MAGSAVAACAWLGSGVRTPVRKALLAGAVTKDTYGRAFGFERMMDRLGAIVAPPASAFFLLQAVNHHYPTLFALTLIPGLVAAGLIAFAVKEKERTPVPHICFGERLQMLPPRFRQFLVAVGLFGAGDFAHTLLILLATQKLTPATAMLAALACCTTCFRRASQSWLAGRPVFEEDRFGDRLCACRRDGPCDHVPAAAAVDAGAIFIAGGVYVAIEETLEDSFCAELVGEEHHGIATFYPASS